MIEANALPLSQTADEDVVCKSVFTSLFQLAYLFKAKNGTVSLEVLCVVVGSVLLMDEAKNDTVPLLSNGGPDVAITMDAVSGDKQRYQQQLQLIDEQVKLAI